MIKLLEWVLEFNPFFRCSASEFVRSKAFTNFKVSKTESTAPFKIMLDIDSDDSFDYATGTNIKYSIPILKDLII